MKENEITNHFTVVSYLFFLHRWRWQPSCIRRTTINYNINVLASGNNYVGTLASFVGYNN